MSDTTEELKEIPFDFEDAVCADDACVGLYSALRMFTEFVSIALNTNEEFNVPGAEAYCMLQDLKKRYPITCAEAEQWYNKYIGTKPIKGA